MNRGRHGGGPGSALNMFLVASVNRTNGRRSVALSKVNPCTGNMSNSLQERGPQVALQSRETSIGLCTRLCCLMISLIVGSSCSREKRAQKADLSSGPELERGIALARKGDFKKAEEAFEQAVILHPRDPRTLAALGQLQEQLGELQESIETFRKVIELDPLSPEAHENLGIALGDRADLASALKESSIPVSP